MDPETPTLTPEEINEKMVSPIAPKDNHWITILSMAIFVLLSLGAVTFLYYQNQNLKNLLATYQTSTPSPTPTITPTQTASASASIKPKSTCKPRPACLDANPACKIAVTNDMCPPSPTP